MREQVDLLKLFLEIDEEIRRIERRFKSQTILFVMMMD